MALARGRSARRLPRCPDGLRRPVVKLCNPKLEGCKCSKCAILKWFLDRDGLYIPYCDVAFLWNSYVQKWTCVVALEERWCLERKNCAPSEGQQTVPQPDPDRESRCHCGCAAGFVKNGREGNCSHAGAWEGTREHPPSSVVVGYTGTRNTSRKSPFYPPAVI